MSSPIPSAAEVETLFREHGGFKDTKNSRVLSETDFWTFIGAVQKLQNRREQWDSVCEEMGKEYTIKHFGERP